jgi:lipoate---protein ligase
MPARRAQRRIPGGKLVRVDAVCEGHHFSKIRITGDFFVHPEEALTNIERDLEASDLNGNEPDLEMLVGAVILANNAQLIGFGGRDIADLLRDIRC